MAKPNKTNNQPEREASLEPDTVTCVVASPLKYNGKRYAEGAPVSLPQTLYDELKIAGVVSPPDPAPAPLAEKPAE